jgi:hypothetical protein
MRAQGSHVVSLFKLDHRQHPPVLGYINPPRDNVAAAPC